MRRCFSSSPGVWTALANGREVRAGALIALAAMLKVYPVYMASFLLLRRRWRALIACAVSALLLVGVSILLIGLGRRMSSSSRACCPSTPAPPPGWRTNPSRACLHGSTSTAGSTAPARRRSPRPPPCSARVSGAAVLAATFLAGLRTSRERSLFGALVAALLLALPVAWIIYEVLLLIPIFDLLAQPFDRGRRGTVRGALLAAAVLLLAFGNHDTITQHAWVPQSYKLFGVLLVWALEMDSLRPWRAPQA